MPLPRENLKVFISHATVEDGGLANWIADALDRLHIRAFVYERYQRGGQNRFEVIKSRIQECPYFLVILTKEGIVSQWVNQEIGYAVAVGKELIPIVEVDNSTGRLIKSKGFVELHDPIEYYRNDPMRLMSEVIYTFYSLLLGEEKWKDSIFLSCTCGNGFDALLDFEKWWEKWRGDPDRIPLTISFTCAKCKQEVEISFPDCHLLPQRTKKD